jgi:CRISPR/Cas system-associated exonuclease Cas4 (RecB family)
MARITKKIFTTYLECPKLAWLVKRNQLPYEDDAARRLLTMEANHIHRIAHETYGEGASAYAKNIKECAENSKNLIAQKAPLIFKAAFISPDNFSTRTDILQKEPFGWHLTEVKTANKKKAKYIEDLAYSAMVIKKCGVQLSDVSLVHLNENYRKGEDYSLLFESHNVTEAVMEKVSEFERMAAYVAETVETDEEPFATLKMKCKNCEMFKNCTGKAIENHIFDLPRLGIHTFCGLRDLGIEKIEDIPDDFELSPLQKNVKNCIINNTRFVSENLKTELEKIVYPAYYLDFESITTALPLYDGVRPHGQIVTQFSLHKRTSPNAELEHFEFIADETKNCAREIATRLIEIFGAQGSIMAYSNSEQVLIKRFSKEFPDLEEPLTAIANRVCDLEIILRNNFYDINFHGRTSIKKILPVIAPEMTYEGLEIGEGAGAAAEFAFIAMGLYDKQKAEETKKHLLKYCALDTLALVKIHDFLTSVSNAPTNTNA